jgi:hypothetical protein
LILTYTERYPLVKNIAYITAYNLSVFQDSNCLPVSPRKSKGQNRSALSPSTKRRLYSLRATRVFRKRKENIHRTHPQWGRGPKSGECLLFIFWFPRKPRKYKSDKIAPLRSAIFPGIYAALFCAAVSGSAKGNRKSGPKNPGTPPLPSPPSFPKPPGAGPSRTSASHHPTQPPYPPEDSLPNHSTRTSPNRGELRVVRPPRAAQPSSIS